MIAARLRLGGGGASTRLACPVAEFARIRAVRSPVTGPPEVLATSATSETSISPHWHAKRVASAVAARSFCRAPTVVCIFCRPRPAANRAAASATGHGCHGQTLCPCLPAVEQHPQSEFEGGTQQIVDRTCSEESILRVSIHRRHWPPDAGTERATPGWRPRADRAGPSAFVCGRPATCGRMPLMWGRAPATTRADGSGRLNVARASSLRRGGPIVSWNGGASILLAIGLSGFARFASWKLAPL